MSEDRSTADPQPGKRITLHVGAQVAALVPQTLDEAWRLSQYFALSGLTPKGIDTPEKVMFVIAGGAEVGFGPFQSLQAFALINGKLTMWGDAVPALLWSRGFKLKEWVENDSEEFPDNMTNFCTITRPDGEEITRKFSVGDAKRAKLWNKKGRDGQDTPWITFPQRMLQMRARGWGARDGASDVLKGIAIREEVEDYDVIEGVVTSTAPALQAPEQQRRRKPRQAAAEGAPAADDGPAHAQEGAGGEEASTGAAEAKDPQQEINGRRSAEIEARQTEDEVQEGCAAPGEVYYHVDFPKLEDGTRIAFMDGSRCDPPRMGDEWPQVYAEHAPEPAEVEEGDAEGPTETDGAQAADPAPATSATAEPALTDGAGQAEGSGPSPQAEDGEAQEAEFEDGLPPEEADYAAAISAAPDFATVREHLSAFFKSAYFLALTSDEQNDIRAETWDTIVATGIELPDHAENCLAFRLWIEAQEDPDAIAGTLAVLEKSTAMQNASPAVAEACRNGAAARIALLKAE